MFNFVFRGTENVSLELISNSSLFIVIFHKPFCENIIVGLSNIKSLILPVLAFKTLKLNPVF